MLPCTRDPARVILDWVLLRVMDMSNGFESRYTRTDPRALLDKVPYGTFPLTVGILPFSEIFLEVSPARSCVFVSVEVAARSDIEDRAHAAGHGIFAALVQRVALGQIRLKIPVVAQHRALPGKFWSLGLIKLGLKPLIFALGRADLLCAAVQQQQQRNRIAMGVDHQLGIVKRRALHNPRHRQGRKASPFACENDPVAGMVRRQGPFLCGHLHGCADFWQERRCLLDVHPFASSLVAVAGGCVRKCAGTSGVKCCA